MTEAQLVAVLFAILAYSMLNIGLILEKKGASELPHIEDNTALENIRNFLHKPKWLIGFLLTNLQIVPFWIALGFGSLSTVTPMMGVGLLVLVIFSRLYLKETIVLPMYLGIGITVAGLILLGITNTKAEPVYSFAELQPILWSWQAVILLFIMLIGILLPSLICLLRKFQQADLLFGIASGFAVALGMLFSKVMTAGFLLDPSVDPVVYNLTTWNFYVFLVLLLSCNVLGMTLQQYGFQKGKAIILVPVFTTLTILLPMLVGIVLFQEWQQYSPSEILLKLGAMFLLLFGVLMLSYFNTRQVLRP
jgi:drug/metabolite transporter (DMT)-like permease